MAKDVLKKIVKAAMSYKNTKPGLVGHPYFSPKDKDPKNASRKRPQKN
ncbi:MAG: hypothetical protein ABIJ28_03385 [Patescibacteria group bacterium]